MRIGILGGTFNPVHVAHMQIAEIAKEGLGLDQVLLMVAADPPHKPVDGQVSAAHRLAMAKLAASGKAGIEASDLEINRTGKSYTVVTLEALSARYPGAALYFIIGSDMLLDMPGWYQPERILELATVAYVPRKGMDSTDAVAADVIESRYGKTVLRLPAYADAYSSTEIRRRLFLGLPVEGMLSPSVERYCYDLGLYFPPEIQAMQSQCREALSIKRYTHTMGCVRTASKLAELWDVDPAKARLAALLHDCAKGMQSQELKALSGDTTDIAPVWHAYAGAVVAERDYGVTDPEVLEAIRLHCTGDTGMTTLDALVYLADMTEPSRSFPGVEELRKALTQGPRAAMLLALTQSKTFIAMQHGAFHPASERALLYYQAK